MHPYQAHLPPLARQLRNNMTKAEQMLWQKLRRQQICGVHFYRQKPLANYIVDFYIKALGLVVEIDGLSHEGKVEYDYSRQLFLESFGIQVFRVGDGEVKNALIDVLERLEQFIIVNYGVFENHP